MLQCPSCDTTLDQDFGMVTCSNCKAVLMIDISGKVQVASDEPEASFDDLETNTDEVSSSFDNLMEQGSEGELQPDSVAEDFSESDDQDSWQDESSFEEDDSDESWSADASMDDQDEGGADHQWDDQLEAENEQSEEIAQFETQGDDQFEEVGVDDQPSAVLSDHDSQQEELETFPMATSADPNPVDVTEFANSEDSNLEDGEILYDVFLARIDSKDLKEALKYVLIDEKLQLNPQDYLKKIKAGKVTIPDLNPIKAKRIVEQLQYTDLDISWRQKRVIMEAIESEDQGDDEDSDFSEDVSP